MEKKFEKNYIAGGDSTLKDSTVKYFLLKDSVKARLKNIQFSIDRLIG